MAPDRGTTAARRYLLGEVGEDEREQIERAYFADETMLVRMEEAEEALIEDYLAERLSPDSRQRFEREFLSRPDRRARIETIRALMAAAGAHSTTGRGGFAAVMRRPVMWRTAVAAAAVVLIAVGAGWESGVFRGRRPAEMGAVAPLQGPVRTFAVSLSAAGTRSSGTTPDIIVPVGTDIVVLRLAAEPGDVPFEHGRAVVRTVSGDEIWSGPATSPADRASGIAASMAVPAPRLGPDDYVITLFAAGPQGDEREVSRYFLRIIAH